MLEVQQLSVWYGAAQALFEVSLRVGAGELVVLQGLNGAGKSTLLQALMGLSQRQTGTVSYQNETVSGWPPHRRALAGLGWVAEDRRLFGALTVRENLLIAARGDVAANMARVLTLFPALEKMLQRRASQMSGGEQQMLAIARTLMTSPKLLLLDEPCEGIAPLLVESIRDALLALRAGGMPMLVAEQNRILADRADRVITLVSGRVAG
jgi:branched-chain amino acid transport system ATP-binding protein